MSSKAPTEDDRLIGRRIRECREAAGLSQNGLAGELGVSYQQVQKYESGQSRITGGRITVAAAFLKVHAGALFSDGNVAGFAEAQLPFASDPSTAEADRVRSGYGRLQDARQRQVILDLLALFSCT